MRIRVLALITIALGGPARGQFVAYLQPPITTSAAGLIPSAWTSPNGFDGDVYTWDKFRLGATVDVSKVGWRGSPVASTTNFNIAIYPSIAAGTQPAIHTAGGDTDGVDALVHYNVTGLTGTPAGTFNGFPMRDYEFTPPATFHAQANTNYWLRILADDGGFGMAKGTGGDGTVFQYFVGGPYYLITPGDTAFTICSTTPVPEPASVLLVGVVALAAGAGGRRVVRMTPAARRSGGPC